jgi:hypothetical protein
VISRKIERKNDGRLLLDVTARCTQIVVYLTSLCVNWAFFGTRGPF